MAAQNSVADIGVKLTADTSSFETSIERAAKKLRALGGTTEAGGKGGGTKPSGGGAGGGTTGAGGGGAPSQPYGDKNRPDIGERGWAR